MANDLTGVLINRQMAKYSLDQFGQRPELLSDAGTTWNAGNNQQLISQGLGNILGSIDAPAQRQELARQEAMAAEKVQYERGQNELTNMLSQRTAARADERLSLDKAAGLRQQDVYNRALLEKRQQQDAIKVKNELSDSVFLANREKEAGIKGTASALVGSGVDLTQGTDGTWRTTNKDLTKDQETQLAELNRLTNATITADSIDSRVKGLVERGKSTKNNPYDDFTYAGLTKDMEAAAAQNNLLTDSEKGKLNEKGALILSKAQAEKDVLLKGGGFTKGSVESEMLNDDLWAYNGNLGESFAQDAIMKNKAIKNKEEAISEYTNRRAEILLKPEVINLVESGQVSESQLEAAMGKAFSNVSDDKWQMSIGIKDDNIINPVLRYLERAAKVNETQFAVQAIDENVKQAVAEMTALSKLGIVK